MAQAIAMTRLRYTVMQFGDRSDESIPTPCQRLQPSLAAGGLREHAPNRRNLNAQIRLFDDEAGPCSAHQRALRDWLPHALNQSRQNGDRSGTQCLRNADAGQYAGAWIEAKRSDFIDRVATLVAQVEWPLSAHRFNVIVAYRRSGPQRVVRHVL